MQDNSATRRNFDSMSVPGLSEEARHAVNAAFDAMSAWRIETAKSTEKNSEQVIEKMAAAARALGWPEQIADATRAHLQAITKMQIQLMDQLMDAWEEQIKSPNPMTAPSAMLSRLKSLPSVSPAGTWPNADAFAGAAMNPMQFWVQLAEQWQKAWADAMGMGVGASGGQRRR
jgi:predicted O-linked N-acetylglucosamine transferase (SPINDLY family)